MERLTYRNSSGEVHARCKERCADNEVCNPDICLNRKLLERLAEYEELEITPEQVRELDKICTEKMQEVEKYKKSEKSLLPLELGNEVYFVDTEEKEIIPTSVIHIEKWLSSLSGDVKIVTKIGCVSELNGKCTVFFYPQDVGEKVFLTREMAEQVLKELAEENKNVD